MHKLLVFRRFAKISGTLKNVKNTFVHLKLIFAILKPWFSIFFYLCTIELFEENITLAFTFLGIKNKVSQPVEGKPTFLVMYVIPYSCYFIPDSRFHYSLLLPPKMRSK